MKANLYWKGIDTLTKNNRILGLALIAMVVWNVFNMSMLRSAKTHQQVALVPMVSGTDLWVGDGKASPTYLRSMGRAIVNAVGNYQAASIRLQLQEILPLFPPDKFGSAQIEFTKLADDIERYPSISSAVHLTGKDPIKSNGRVLQVRVSKERLVNGAVSETHQSHYCIDYRIEETRFWVLAINEKEGPGEDLCFIDDKTNGETGKAADATKTVAAGG